MIFFKKTDEMKLRPEKSVEEHEIIWRVVKGFGGNVEVGF